MVDISGSMRHKLQQALQTAREISLALSEQDEMFLLTFNTDVDMRQRLTSNKARRALAAGHSYQRGYFRLRCNRSGSERNEIGTQSEKNHGADIGRI
jgi:hypothetical protein